MKIADKMRAFRWAGGLLALALMLPACGTEDGGMEPSGAPANGTGAPANASGATETVSRDRSSNVPYVPWQFLTAKGGTAGGATVYGGKAYFAYIRSDSTIGIIIETNLSNSGQSPTTMTLPPDIKAQYGVSLVVYNGWLYMFYIDLQRNMSMVFTADGLNWYGPGALDSDPFPGNWNCPPTPVVWNGGLTVMGCGVNGWIVELAVSGSWSTGWKVTGWDTPNNGPASYNKIGAYVWQGGLYIAWADTAHNNQLYVAHTLGFPGDWRESAVVGQQGIPSLSQVTNGQLEMVYRGNDAHIYKTFTSDGASYGQAFRDSASTTNHAPIPFENWGQTGNWVFYIGVNNGLFAVLE